MARENQEPSVLHLLHTPRKPGLTARAIQDKASQTHDHPIRNLRAEGSRGVGPHVGRRGLR